LARRVDSGTRVATAGIGGISAVAAKQAGREVLTRSSHSSNDKAVSVRVLADPMINRTAAPQRHANALI
jgi:hypothetical protein